MLDLDEQTVAPSHDVVLGDHELRHDLGDAADADLDRDDECCLHLVAELLHLLGVVDEFLNAGPKVCIVGCSN